MLNEPRPNYISDSPALCKRVANGERLGAADEGGFHAGWRAGKLYGGEAGEEIAEHRAELHAG